MQRKQQAVVFRDGSCANRLRFSSVFVDNCFCASWTCAVEGLASRFSSQDTDTALKLSPRKFATDMFFVFLRRTKQG